VTFPLTTLLPELLPDSLPLVPTSQLHEATSHCWLPLKMENVSSIRERLHHTDAITHEIVKWHSAITSLPGPLYVLRSATLLGHHAEMSERWASEISQQPLQQICQLNGQRASLHSITFNQTGTNLLLFADSFHDLSPDLPHSGGLLTSMSSSMPSSSPETPVRRRTVAVSLIRPPIRNPIRAMRDESRVGQRGVDHVRCHLFCLIRHRGLHIWRIELIKLTAEPILQDFNFEVQGILQRSLHRTTTV
jgi:hypothetical protein